MSGLRVPMLGQDNPAKEVDLEVLGSTMFDLEMEEVASPRTQNAQLQNHLNIVQQKLAPLLNAHEIAELRLARDVRWLNHTTLKEDGRRDSVVLASKLVNIGYKVAIRTAMGGGTGQDCFHNLHHEFLVVAERHQEVIVDCHFKDQFKISQYTQQYQQTLNCLPEVFVCSALRLAPLVDLMCTEMATAFKSQGVTCPPWRQPRSMISKWLPSKCQDRYISRGAVSARKSSSSSVCSSDDGIGALSDSGASPTGPLPPYQDSELDSRHWHKVDSHPLMTLTGFRVKSLLSSGLAAINTKQRVRDQEVWKQPTIRTVRMTGRPLMQQQVA
ncbi:hypothetical protein ABBQ32_002107 [Trebouxia sp. C0010 RCD-2024]